MGSNRPRGATPPPAPPASRRRARAGFTMVELLLVIAMVGAIVAIAMPRMSTFRETSAVRAARLELVTSIEAARAAAIQRGRTGRVRIRGDSLLVTVDTGGPSGPSTGRYTVLATKSLKREFTVSVAPPSAGDTVIAYDSRGLASPRLAQTAVYVLTRNTIRDSVCVSRLGMILPARCTP